ncbi:MAG: sulfurtransferase TusA family protein [Candidatus Omnitrophica bacterium]|nr:sulfurtransferase TusA family protein [Candidatus Omnitrophota bacterium]
MSDIKINKKLDLKGVSCPLNYVKAKLFMEGLDAGEIAQITLDDGEPIKNVPASLRDDGYEILKIEKADGYYKIIAKKGNL